MADNTYKLTQARQIGSVLVEVTGRWVWIVQDGRNWKFPHGTFKGTRREQILNILKCDKWTAAELEDFFKEWLPVDRRFKPIKVHNVTDIAGQGVPSTFISEGTKLQPPIVLKDGTKVARNASSEFLFEKLTDEQYQEFADILMSEETK